MWDQHHKSECGAAKRLVETGRAFFSQTAAPMELPLDNYGAEECWILTREELRKYRSAWLCLKVGL